MELRNYLYIRATISCSIDINYFRKHRIQTDKHKDTNTQTHTLIISVREKNKYQCVVNCRFNIG